MTQKAHFRQWIGIWNPSKWPINSYWPNNDPTWPNNDPTVINLNHEPSRSSRKWLDGIWFHSTSDPCLGHLRWAMTSPPFGAPTWWPVASGHPWVCRFVVSHQMSGNLKHANIRRLISWFDFNDFWRKKYCAQITASKNPSIFLLFLFDWFSDQLSVVGM